jgi:hypothetical protein
MPHMRAQPLGRSARALHVPARSSRRREVRWGELGPEVLAMAAGSGMGTREARAHSRIQGWEGRIQMWTGMPAPSATTLTGTTIPARWSPARRRPRRGGTTARSPTAQCARGGNALSTGGTAHPSWPPPAGHAQSHSLSSNGGSSGSNSNCFRRLRNRSDPAPDALGEGKHGEEVEGVEERPCGR